MAMHLDRVAFSFRWPDETKGIDDRAVELVQQLNSGDWRIISYDHDTWHDLATLTIERKASDK